MCKDFYFTSGALFTLLSFGLKNVNTLRIYVLVNTCKMLGTDTDLCRRLRRDRACCGLG